MAPSKKNVAPVGESESDDAASQSGSVSGGSAGKKTRKVPLEKVLAMLKKGDVEKATVALEALVGDKKDKKQREPSAFNKFVKETMAELKDSKLSTKEKMAKCAEMWRAKKGAAAA
jgi:hypothetical protein